MEGLMDTVDIRDAKTNLARLLTRVAAGEIIVISRAGKPVATLTRYEGPAAPNRCRIGFLRGRVTVPADFHTMGADVIADAFSGVSGQR